MIMKKAMFYICSVALLLMIGCEQDYIPTSSPEMETKQMLEDNSLMKVESGISMNDYEERQKTIEQILSNKDSEKSTSNRPRLLSLTFYEGDSVNVEQETQRTTGWVRDTQWAIMPGWSAVGQTGIYAYPPPWEEVNIIQTPIILAPEDHRLGYSGSTGASRTVYYIDIFTEQKWSRFGNA